MAVFLVVLLDDLGETLSDGVEIATGEIFLDATAGSDVGIDVVSSEYAVIAAEQTALENLSREVADRIVTRVALRLREGAARAGE